MAESKWTRHEVQFRGVPNECIMLPDSSAICRLVATSQSSSWRHHVASLRCAVSGVLSGGIKVLFAILRRY